VLAWQHNALEVLPFKGWRTRPAPLDWSLQHGPERIARTPDVPEAALMRVRLSLDKGKAPADLALLLGKPDGLAIGEMIREGWQRTFELSGHSYTLVADYVKGPEGKVLPGSMRLSLHGKDKTPSHVVLGRAPGHIFREQRVLWAGHLTSNPYPDFLIQRTLLTGEKDYILSLAHADGSYTAAGVTIDEDHPQKTYDCPIMDQSDTSELELSSPRPYPVYRLTEKPVPWALAPNEYAKSGNLTLNHQILYEYRSTYDDEGQALPLTPGVKQNMVFAYSGETYRILVEVMAVYSGEPLYSSPQGYPRYISGIAMGALGDNGSIVAVSMFHKGLREVLLVNRPDVQDGLLLNLTAGNLDESGLLSILIEWSPEYDNEITEIWKQTDSPGRIMRRISIRSSSG